MPHRWCQCTGCPACSPSGRTHGILYDLDTTGTLRCPACQQHATARRNARPSSSARGLGWAFTRRKQAGVLPPGVCVEWAATEPEATDGR